MRSSRRRRKRRPISLQLDPSELAIIRLALADRIVRFGATTPAGIAAARLLNHITDTTS